MLREFEDHLRRTQDWSARTNDRYLGVLRSYLANLGDQDDTTNTHEFVRKFIRNQSRSWSPSAQSVAVAALQHYLQWRGASITSLERPRVPRKLIKVIDEEDLPLIVRVVEQRSPEEQLLFELLYGSGLRLSEAFDLKAKWRTGRRLRVFGKGRSWREVPITPRAAELLQGISGDESPWSVQTHPQTLRSWVREWGRLAGLEVQLHPHLLRHSLATHLLRRGAPLSSIQKLLGHKRMSTTERYTHLLMDDLVQIYDKSFPLQKPPKLG